MKKEITAAVVEIDIFYSLTTTLQIAIVTRLDPMGTAVMKMETAIARLVTKENSAMFANANSLITMAFAVLRVKNMIQSFLNAEVSNLWLVDGRLKLIEKH